MSKVFQPEHVVTDNPHGAMVYGPVTTEKDDDGTRYVQTVKGGHTIIVNENGNKLDHTPGTHNELCGTGLVEGKNTKSTDEAVAKAIVARHGDIVIVAFAQNTPGGGSVHALPMARKMLQTWYNLESKENIDRNKD